MCYEFKERHNMKKTAIVGGGISGLAAAWFLLKKNPALKITLFESENRLGGKIQTSRENGFLFEHGPNGFMDSRQEMVDFCNDLGFKEEIVKSNDDAANRFILKNGRLCALPKKPPQIFTSGFLPLSAKLRLMTEPFRRKSKLEDESLYDFCNRRFGKYVAEYLVDPFTSGVFGADCRQLSIRSAFKPLWEMEQQYGSIFKAMKKKMKAAKGKKQGKLSSFKDGMEELIKGLERQLQDKITIRLNSPVKNLSKNDSAYTLETNDIREDFDIVILACPAAPCGRLLSSLNEALGEEVSSIPYSAISVVPQGFNKPKPAVANAFGYLVPSAEKSKILGNLFDASVFPNRAPQNSFSIRTMLGGGKDPEIINFTDEEVYSLILEENRQTLGIDFDADIKKIIRWQQAIPVYGPGHWKLVEKIEKFTEKTGLFVSGNAFYGVSMNDCVTSAVKTAEKIEDYLKEK